MNKQLGNWRKLVIDPEKKDRAMALLQKYLQQKLIAFEVSTNYKIYVETFVEEVLNTTYFKDVFCGLSILDIRKMGFCKDADQRLILNVRNEARKRIQGERNNKAAKALVELLDSMKTENCEIQKTVESLSSLLSEEKLAEVGVVPPDNENSRNEAVDVLNTLHLNKEREEDSQETGDFEGTFSTLLSQETSSIRSRGVQTDCTLSDSFASLPALDLNGDKIHFQHSDPANHSMNVPNVTAKGADGIFNQSRLSPTSTSDNNGLLEWKGTVLDTRNEPTSNSPNNDVTSTTIVVQLQRKENNHLGFSLIFNENNTFVITNIKKRSAASYDGRLKVGDQIVEINGSDVRDFNSNELIELLRTVQGTVTIKVLRSKLEPIAF